MSPIDLICLTNGIPVPAWRLGRTLATRSNAEAVAKAVEQLTTKSETVAVLFWDALLGTPDQEFLLCALKSPGDVWHAGLKLGMSGQPGITRFVSPTWMLNCDPPPDIEATSWRLSLRACLVRSEVDRKSTRLNSSHLTQSRMPSSA